jgi:hypothetical protein
MSTADPTLDALPGVAPDPFGDGCGLNEWKQGHLVSCPPLLWVTIAGALDPVTGMQAGEGQGHVAQEHQSPAQHAIITSQTCNIGLAGPGARFPFVQVSPVIRVDDLDSSVAKQLRSGAMTDRYVLTAPGLDETQIADLRISVPMSKSVLRDLQPIDAFADENEYLRFARHLGQMVTRPAFHDAVNDVLITRLRKAAKTGKAAMGWSKVCEIRLLVKGDRINPEWVRLLVVSDTEALTEEERIAWKEWTTGLAGEVASAGLTLRATLFCAMNEGPIFQYAQATELSVPEIRR